MEIDLKGKVAFVTGGTKGIGGAVSEVLAGCGANVAFMARNTEDLKMMEELINSRNGGRALAIQGDVSDAETLRKAVEKIIHEFGALHLAVNNAGIAGSPALLHESTLENWHKVMGVNLDGVYYAMKYEITEMLKAGRGSIVNIGSVEGHTILPEFSAYVATKHAISGLTKVCAREYADKGIRINTVCPGVIRTPLVEAPGQKEVTDRLEATIPMGRLGESVEIAYTVAFLLSDLSSYTTGVDVIADGAFLLRG